jgi:nucleoside-diphosphate-sugar epimerase
MATALILGGTGAIGTATALRLARAGGWNVTVTGRDASRMPPELAAAGVRFVRADDRIRAEIAGRHHFDLVVDCVCFTAAHAQDLLRVADRSRSTVMISSKAVYVDAHGRHANSDEPPQFPCRPIQRCGVTTPGRIASSHIACPARGPSCEFLYEIWGNSWLEACEKQSGRL